jgi:hypothetical protein
LPATEDPHVDIDALLIIAGARSGVLLAADLDSVALRRRRQFDAPLAVLLRHAGIIRALASAVFSLRIGRRAGAKIVVQDEAVVRVLAPRAAVARRRHGRLEPAVELKSRLNALLLAVVGDTVICAVGLIFVGIVAARIRPLSAFRN